MKSLTKWFKEEGTRGGLIEIISVDWKTGKMTSREPRWILRPIFAWYDLWVGLFIDRKERKVYFFPIPCVGVVFYWG